MSKSKPLPKPDEAVMSKADARKAGVRPEFLDQVLAKFEYDADEGNVERSQEAALAWLKQLKFRLPSYFRDEVLPS